MLMERVGPRLLPRLSHTSHRELHRPYRAVGRKPRSDRVQSGMLDNAAFGWLPDEHDRSYSSMH